MANTANNGNGNPRSCAVAQTSGEWQGERWHLGAVCGKARPLCGGRAFESLLKQNKKNYIYMFFKRWGEAGIYVSFAVLEGKKEPYFTTDERKRHH